MSTRLALFLYGTPNIVACLCALAVLALYFGGVIRTGWLVLTVGAYLAGWFAVPRKDAVVLDALQDKPLTEVMHSIVAAFSHRLPAEARAQLIEVQQVVEEVGARCEDAAFPVQTRIELRNAVSRDLPATLSNYLALPPGFARLHVVHAGKTAYELLRDQLRLLQEALRSLSHEVYAQDADKLVAQGEYLKQKFRPIEFLAN